MICIAFYAIANEFSTAAYRFGHTMLSGSFTLADSDGPFGSPIELKDVFFDADFFDGNGTLVDYVLGGLQEGLAKEIDPMLTDAVRDFLFGAPDGPGSCLDLAALNIQRGRDHGLPSYNDLRETMGLTRYTSFAEMTSDTERQGLLDYLYQDVDKVDAWVGMLSEDHVQDASVGELLGTMLKDQFDRLMLGDPFFYKGDDDLKDSVLIANVMDVESVTLQRIIGRNTVVQYPESKSAFIHDSDIPLSAVRTIDGTDRADGAGAAEELLLRLSSDLTYPDEVGEEVWNNTNPRMISNVLMKETEVVENSRGLLDMVWQWGQFLDHDIDLTEPAAAYGNMTIVIPDDPTDPFIENNCLEIFMDRSEYEHGEMIGAGHLREQVSDCDGGKGQLVCL